MRGRRLRHTEEFKLDAVRMAEKSPRPIADVARDLGIGRSTLHSWYAAEMAKRVKKPASAKPSGAESPDERIARLERENERLLKKVESLETDREILKKAAAFFAKDSE